MELPAGMVNVSKSGPPTDQPANVRHHKYDFRAQAALLLEELRCPSADIFAPPRGFSPEWIRARKPTTH